MAKSIKLFHSNSNSDSLDIKLLFNQITQDDTIKSKNDDTVALNTIATFSHYNLEASNNSNSVESKELLEAEYYQITSPCILVFNDSDDGLTSDSKPAESSEELTSGWDYLGEFHTITDIENYKTAGALEDALNI